MLETRVQPASTLEQRHDRVLAMLACTLCVSAQLKFAQVQLLELIYAADMVIVSAWLFLHPPPIHVFRPFFRMAFHWALFGAACFLLSLVALRRDFYFDPRVTGINAPLMVTVARLIELLLDVFAFVYLACRFREDQTLCRSALRWYCAIGVAGCAWGWCKAFISIAVGTFGSYRMTGFNNEGGPFGVYLITVMVAVVALWQKEWLDRRTFSIVMPFLVVSLIASKSKAALIEIAVFVFVIAFLKTKPVKAFFVAIPVVLVVIVVFQALGLSKPLLAYIKLSDQYAAISLVRPRDFNFVIGRVAGSYLTPRMIAAHPLTGIGLGNYPLVRDDPQYRQGSVIVEAPLDSPSLGFIDYLVETGIPLFLYLTWIQVAPAVVLLRNRASVGTVALILVMPISLWFGAHLNMTYPWVAGALALGIFYSDHHADGRTMRAAFRNTDTMLASNTGYLPG